MLYQYKCFIHFLKMYSKLKMHFYLSWGFTCMYIGVKYFMLQMKWLHVGRQSMYSPVHHASAIIIIILKHKFALAHYIKCLDNSTNYTRLKTTNISHGRSRIGEAHLRLRLMWAKNLLRKMFRYKILHDFDVGLLMVCYPKRSSSPLSDFLSDLINGAY